MEDLYKRIEELCGQKDISIYKLCKEAGIRTSVLTDLKAGRKKGLNSATISKLASCLHVSADAILGGDSVKAKEAAENVELEEYLEELKNRPEMRMLFKLAKGATKEDVEQAVKIIEALQK